MSAPEVYQAHPKADTAVLCPYTDASHAMGICQS